MNEKAKIAWWRYALGVVAFVVCMFLAPLIIYLTKSLAAYIPFLGRESTGEMWLIAYVIAPFIANAVSRGVFSRKCWLSVVLCVIAGAYSIFVATWNYVAGENGLILSLGIGIGGLIYIGLAIAQATEISRERNANDGKAA